LKKHMALYRFSAARGPYLFHHEHARRHAKRGERVRSFRRAFDSAAARAKLPDNFVRHDLRYTRCTWWLEDGIDISTVQMAMGHSDVKVTQKYTHLTRRNLRKMRPV
jgi:site-specific recombinase XerD